MKERIRKEKLWKKGKFGGGIKSAEEKSERKEKKKRKEKEKKKKDERKN